MYNPYATEEPERILHRTDYGTIVFRRTLHPDDLGDLSTHFYEAKLNGRIEGFLMGLVVAVVALTLWYVFK